MSDGDNMPAKKQDSDVVEKPDAAEEERRERTAKDHAVIMINPALRHAQIAAAFTGRSFVGNPYLGEADLFTFGGAVLDEIGRAGNLKTASQTLAAQAMSLDTIFTEMARRSELNMVDYPEASERYMRLALKAQSNCRSTLEALAKLHQPREQIVKHIHVNEGGQAVVADQFNHYGGIENAKTGERPHAIASTTTIDGETLRSEDPSWDAVQVPRDAKR